MLPAIKAVTNVDPRHIKEVVKAGHLPVRAFILPIPPEGLPIPIPCQFNPDKITYTYSNRYTFKHGDKKDRATPTYNGGDVETLSMKLDFDTAESGYVDVRLLIYPLLTLLHPNPIMKALGWMKKVQPPTFLFIWGMFSVSPNMCFRALMEDISVDFTYFSPEGIPLRAETTIKFRAVPSLLPAQNPTSRSEAWKMRIVADGETLDYIAYQEYGDSAKWRHIAAVNDIANPMALRAGTVLKLTPLEGVASR